LGIRQALWRVALLGGVVTASLQVGLGVEPVGGSWGLATVTSPAAAPPLELSESTEIQGATPAVANAPATRRLPPWPALWAVGFAMVVLPLAVAYRRFRLSIAD